MVKTKASADLSVEDVEKKFSKVPLIKNRIRRAALMLKLKTELKKSRKVE